MLSKNYATWKNLSVFSFWTRYTLILEKDIKSDSTVATKVLDSTLFILIPSHGCEYIYINLLKKTKNH